MSRSASTFLKIARACCCNVSRKLPLFPPWQRNEIRPRVSFRRISRSLLLPALFFSSFAFGRSNDPDEFVDIKSVDKTIVIDLRYASANNVAHRPLYPVGPPALLPASVANRPQIAPAYPRNETP